jgi:hypothetical protein
MTDKKSAPPGVTAPDEAPVHADGVEFENDDRLLVTAKEAARLLSVEPYLIYQWSAGGLIERRYIGARSFRIPLDSLREFVERRMPGEPRDNWG